MLKKLVCFSLCLLAISLLPMLAFAADGYSYDQAPFESLAAMAGQIGCGLRQSGLIIGGFALIALSSMAVFGKINWKTLWYIMLSLFVLSLMAAVIGAITTGERSVGGTERRVSSYCQDMAVSNFLKKSDIDKGAF